MVSEAQAGQARRKAESKMLTECLIESGEFTGGVWDEAALAYTEKIPLASYGGKCEWLAAGTSPREVDAAGQIVTLQSPLLKLPVEGSSSVKVGQSGRITANPLDPSLVGTRFRIAGDRNQTFSATRRFPVEVS